MGYSPWGHKELDTTERLTCSHHSLSKPVLAFSHSLHSCLCACGQPSSLRALSSHWSSSLSPAPKSRGRGSFYSYPFHWVRCLSLRYFNQWKPTYSANGAGALNIKSVLMLPNGISRWCPFSYGTSLCASRSGMEEAHPECSPVWIPSSTGSGRRPSHHHLLSRATEKLLGSRAGVSPQVKGPDKEGLEEWSGVSCWGWACTEDSMDLSFLCFFFSSCNRSNGAQHPYRVSAFGLNLEEEGKWDPEMKSKLHVSSVASRD